jgi:Xaa-Pro aminopeptidase
VPARAILFCREKNLEREIWDGFRYGPEGARGLRLRRRLPIGARRADGALLADAPALYYALGTPARCAGAGWLDACGAWRAAA